MAEGFLFVVFKLLVLEFLHVLVVDVFALETALAVALTSGQLFLIFVVNALLYYLLVNKFLHVYLDETKRCIVRQMAKILELVHLTSHTF